MKPPELDELRQRILAGEPVWAPAIVEDRAPGELVSIAAWLTHEDERIRLFAIEALSAAGFSDASRALLAVARVREGIERARAIRALAALLPPESEEFFIHAAEWLSDQDERVRAATRVLIRRAADPDSLTKVVQHEEIDEAEQLLRLDLMGLASRVLAAANDEHQRAELLAELRAVPNNHLTNIVSTVLSTRSDDLATITASLVSTRKDELSEIDRRLILAELEMALPELESVTAKIAVEAACDLLRKSEVPVLEPSETARLVREIRGDIVREYRHLLEALTPGYSERVDEEEHRATVEPVVTGIEHVLLGANYATFRDVVRQGFQDRLNQGLPLPLLFTIPTLYLIAMRRAFTRARGPERGVALTKHVEVMMIRELPKVMRELISVAAGASRG